MIIRLADCPSVPWKNGLGHTREIAIHPSASGGDDFTWRVSIAEVDSAAPFSRFPGIDRHIVLLQGAGFTMTLDGRDTHALTTPFIPFAFAGEACVDVALADGATRDFNLMVNRARACAEVKVWQGPGSHRVEPNLRLVYCACGAIDTVEGLLHAGDAWRRSETSTGALVLHDDTVALAVVLKAHGA